MEELPLDVRVVNQLQERKDGQTIEQLRDALHEPLTDILTVLMPLLRDGHVAKSESGVWTLVRE